MTTDVAEGDASPSAPMRFSRVCSAHEFGHILGFKDAYFRGYRDLGADGFEVMEVVADVDDIMGASGTDGETKTLREVGRSAVVRERRSSAHGQSRVGQPESLFP